MPFFAASIIPMIKNFMSGQQAIIGALALLFFGATGCGSFSPAEKKNVMAQLDRIDKTAKGQAALSADVTDLRRAMMTMTAQVEEFNERARILTDGMARLERSFSEMATSYRSESIERTAAANRRLEAVESQIAELSLETRAFIKIMEKKNGVTSRTHRQEVEALKAKEQKNQPRQGTNVAVAISPSTEPADQYQEAYNVYLEGDYERAVTLFTTFLQSHPATSLSDNAAFWVGESWFAAGDYARAAIAFDRTAHEYPNSIKAPAALLRSADSLDARNDSDAARERLRVIIDKYPTSNEAVKAADRLAARPAEVDGEVIAPE